MEGLGGAGAGGAAKPKKRRKKKKHQGGGSLVIVDADAGGGIPQAREDEGEGEGEDAPLVVNAAEVDRERALKDRANILRSNQQNWQTVERVPVPAKPATPQHAEEDEEGGDLSPPRRRGERHDSDDDGDDDGASVSSDLDVGRRARYDSDASDNESDSGGGDSDSDLDVTRRRPSRGGEDDSDSDSDLDVRRRGGGGASSSEDEGAMASGAQKTMLDGTKTGLVSSSELARELEEKQRQKLKRFEKMDPELSGKAAQTVYRDRGTGRALTQVSHLRYSFLPTRHTRTLSLSFVQRIARRNLQMMGNYE